MKAVRPQQLTLSIGMIVKNEEKNLATCLDALQPLRDAVSSELIIVDTGSEDATVEIAKKYTDQVYNFEWIDDFAAARNVGLDHAKGIWFFYLDADEWLESVDAIVDFLKKPEGDYAAMTIRSYGESDGSYQDFAPMRIFRRSPKRRFIGRVHEYIQQESNSVILDAVVKHMGYADREFVQEKINNRNIPLLERLMKETTPTVHDYYQIAKEYALIGKEKEATESFKSGIELEETEHNEALKLALYHDYINSLANFGRLDEALEIAEKRIEDGHPEVSGDIDIYYQISNVCLLKGMNEKALVHCSDYFRVLKGIENGTVSRADQTATTVLYATETYSALMREKQVVLLRKLERYKEVLEALDSFDFIKHGKNRGLQMELLIESSFEMEDYSRIPDLCKRIREDGNTALLERFYDCLDRQCNAHEDAVPELCDFFESVIPEDAYVPLLNLRLADLRGEPDTEMLLSVMANAPLESWCAILVKYALKWKVDFMPFASRIGFEGAAGYASRVRNGWEEFSPTVRDYYLNKAPAASRKELFWETCLCEQSILMGHVMEEASGDILYERFCRSLYLYVSGLYMPDVLENDSDLLPKGHQFAIAAHKAYQAKDAGDRVGFLRLLADAAKIHVLMLPAVTFIGGRVQAELDAEELRARNAEQERTMLYTQVKDNIRVLIESGDIVNAAEVLSQYEKINPTDTELPALFQQLENPVKPS